MAYEIINLVAGVPYLHQVAGSRLLMDNIGEAPGVDVQLVHNGQPTRVMPMRKAAFLFVADSPYEGAIFRSSVNARIGVFMTFNQVNLGITDGATVKIPDGVEVISSPEDPVHVSISAPIEIGSVKVNNTNAEAMPVQQQALAVIVNGAPVNVSTVPTVISADATLKILRIRNSHPTAEMAIGGAGMTLANAAIVLLPGDVWEETNAAGATWYAVSSGPAISVKIQGLK